MIRLGLGLGLFLNNYFCEGGRDLKSGLTVTNKGAADPLVPTPRCYDLGKGLGFRVRVRVAIRVRVGVMVRVEG